MPQFIAIFHVCNPVNSTESNCSLNEILDFHLSYIMPPLLFSDWHERGSCCPAQGPKPQTAIPPGSRPQEETSSVFSDFGHGYGARGEYHCPGGWPAVQELFHPQHIICPILKKKLCQLCMLCFQLQVRRRAWGLCRCPCLACQVRHTRLQHLGIICTSDCYFNVVWKCSSARKFEVNISDFQVQQR